MQYPTTVTNEGKGTVNPCDDFNDEVAMTSATIAINKYK